MQGRTQGRLSLFGLIVLLFGATLFTFAHAAPQATSSTEPDDVVAEGGGESTSGIDESIPTETAEIEPDDSGKANTTEITEDIIIEEAKQDPIVNEEKKEIEAEIEDTVALFEDDGTGKRGLMDLGDLEERNVNDLKERNELDSRSLFWPPRCRRRRCRILARVIRAFFRWAARRFRKKNPGSGMRPHHTHMFFLYPLHRSLFDANIRPRVWFHARWVAPRFLKSAGVTFLKRVYVLAKYAPFRRHDSAASQKAFFDQTWLLAHQYQHVKQYREVGWDIGKFADKYIYGWCMAGKKYSKNPMEISANKAADKLLPLLKTETRFFRFWQRDLLRHDLGYPVQTSYHNAGKDLRQLSFQRGAMQLDTRKSCYRKKMKGPWGPWRCGNS
ncbi:hypothetical protein FSOLCH5_008588 [Fusarium solani]